jgi:DNA-binding transcriptional LysR family regulator
MALDLEAVRAFVKAAELGSFTQAGDHLGLSKSRVSLRVKALEEEVGAHLLQRSTRVVRLTSDGEQFLARARRLVLDADEVGAMFQAPSTLRGQVRLDLPVNFARDLFLPRIPELLAAHPQLELLVSTTDRRVDVVREGFDCVLRIGALADSELVSRRLGMLPMVNCASPAYLLKHGTPRVPADLDGHLVVHYSLAFGTDTPSFEYRDGERYRERPMKSVITVNNADAYHAACVAGLGIVQAPRSGMRASLASGALVEVLPAFTCAPMPVSLVHSHGHNVPKRVRAVLAWVAALMAPQLEGSTT